MSWNRNVQQLGMGERPVVWLIPLSVAEDHRDVIRDVLPPAVNRSKVGKCLLL